MSAASQKVSQKSTLAELRYGCLKAHEAFQKAKTRYTAKIHVAHLVQTLSEQPHIQRHVDLRWPGVSPATAAQAISTFRTVWK